MDPNPSQPNDLHGWKAIAAYLGKSVRAAQRWERELRLPVRRIKTSRGFIVFARRQELDEWRASIAVSLENEPPPGATPPADVIDGPEQPGTWRVGGFPATLLVIGAALAVAMAAAAWWLRAPRIDGDTTYAFTSDAFVALRGGREIWRHTFDHPLNAERAATRGTHFDDAGGRTRVVDLDGDGSPEIVAAVPVFADSATVSDSLYCFSGDGAVRWVYTPDVTLHFRAGEFTGPWMFSALAVSTGPEPAVYVALKHQTWWPTAVMRIDGGGRAELRFVQAGQIYGLHAWRAGDQRLVAAAGINNAYAGGAVALFREDGPPVHSPQTPGSQYECTACPPGLPVKYFLFGRTEVNRASLSPYNRADGFQEMHAALRVFVQEDFEVPGAFTMYDIGPDLSVEGGEPADPYWLAHDRAVESGRIQHRAGRCDARSSEVRSFTPAGGWSVRPVTFTGPRPGGTD